MTVWYSVYAAVTSVTDCDVVIVEGNVVNNRSVRKWVIIFCYATY